MKTKLKTDHTLFQKLKDDSPLWWKNLKSDPELYIDIRKDNYLNVYYNGGSIMKLEWDNKYKAKINSEYIPLQIDIAYPLFIFEGEKISLKEYTSIDINNFEKSSLNKIKKRIEKFYPNNSEKGIQGQYVIKNNRGSKNAKGLFIDTEFQFKKDMRVDIIWVDIDTEKIALVELKKIGDVRLYKSKNKTQREIHEQLKKYYDFAHNNRNDLVQYYNMVYCIKKKLGLLPSFISEKSLDNYELIEKPILLLVDCTNEWIHDEAEDLNESLKEIAFGCLYHGKTKYNFEIPYKTSRNCFRLDEA